MNSSLDIMNTFHSRHFQASNLALRQKHKTFLSPRDYKNDVCIIHLNGIAILQDGVWYTFYYYVFLWPVTFLMYYMVYLSWRRILKHVIQEELWFICKQKCRIRFTWYASLPKNIRLWNVVQILKAFKFHFMVIIMFLHDR